MTSTIKVDTISENTSANGVAVDGVTLKDSKVTANGGLVADNITIDGTEIDLSSGNLNIDVAGYLTLNNDAGGLVLFADASVEFGAIENASSDFVLRAGVQDKDMLFKGNDNGSTITALSLDMSAAGAATFNSGITIPSGSIGVVNSDNPFFQGTATNHGGLQCGTNNILPCKSGSNADATLDLGIGDVRWKDLYLSGGAFIGGNGAANKLDDYEEGTYTPAFTVASGSLTVHSSHNTLAYTKIGRVVHVQGEIRFSAISSPSGNMSLNLPFAVADLAEGAARFTSAPIGQSGFNGTPNQTYYGSVKGEGVDTMFISTHNSGSDTGVNANQVTTNTEMIFSFTMIAA